MKRLVNKQNTDSISVDYPYGSMRDRSAGIQGSEMNTEFHSDYVQFFEKMFAESGLTANGLPDNATNGFQIWNAFRGLTRPYKIYSAVFKYQPTPNRIVVETVLQDEMNLGSIVLSEQSSGVYSLDIGALYSSGFNKNVVLNNRLSYNNKAIRAFFDYNAPNDYLLTIETSVLGSNPTTEITGSFFLEFRVYD